MPILFLILVPFFLVSEALKIRARRQLTPEQKKQVACRSRRADIAFVVFVAMLFVNDFLVPDRWREFGSWGIFISFFCFNLASLSKNPANHNNVEIPASYDQQMMVSYRVLQTGMIIFTIGCVAIILFVRR